MSTVVACILANLAVTTAAVLLLRHEIRSSRTWRHGYAVGRRVGLAQASEGQNDETAVTR